MLFYSDNEHIIKGKSLTTVGMHVNNGTRRHSYYMYYYLSRNFEIVMS